MNEHIIQAADLVVGDIIVDEFGRHVPVEAIDIRRNYLVVTNPGQDNQMSGFVWQHVTVLRPD